MSSNPMQRWPVWYITVSTWRIRYIIYHNIKKCYVAKYCSRRKRANTENQTPHDHWCYFSLHLNTAKQLNLASWENRPWNYNPSTVQVLMKWLSFIFSSWVMTVIKKTNYCPNKCTGHNKASRFITLHNLTHIVLIIVNYSQCSASPSVWNQHTRPQSFH